MTITEIIKRINEVDWEAYNGSPWYNSEKVAPALTRLANLQKESSGSSVENLVLSTIGNNHAGAYYPVIQSALDLIITLAEQNENSIARRHAQEILYDLVSFNADTEGYRQISNQELEHWVNQKLSKYHWKPTPVKLYS